MEWTRLGLDRSQSTTTTAPCDAHEPSRWLAFLFSGRAQLDLFLGRFLVDCCFSLMNNCFSCPGSGVLSVPLVYLRWNRTLMDRSWFLLFMCCALVIGSVSLFLFPMDIRTNWYCWPRDLSLVVSGLDSCLMLTAFLVCSGIRRQGCWLCYCEYQSQSG